MAVGDAHVFPAFLTPVLTQISFQSHRLLFSHASAEVRGVNTPKRNFASTGSQTHKDQVRSPTRSPLSHRAGRYCSGNSCFPLHRSYLNALSKFTIPSKPFYNHGSIKLALCNKPLNHRWTGPFAFTKYNRSREYRPRSACGDHAG